MFSGAPALSTKLVFVFRRWVEHSSSGRGIRLCADVLDAIHLPQSNCRVNSRLAEPDGLVAEINQE